MNRLLLLLTIPCGLMAAEPPNPKIDYEGFARLATDLKITHEQNRISEADFIRMAAEPGTIILDARTTDKFDQIHVKGAVHLAFTDFTAEALAKVIPDKTTRILIYCNNNFKNQEVFFASKFAPVSLNAQTFINLHAYGYENVKELGPLLDVWTTHIPFEGPASPVRATNTPAPK